MPIEDVFTITVVAPSLRARSSRVSSTPATNRDRRPARHQVTDRRGDVRKLLDEGEAATSAPACVDRQERRRACQVLCKVVDGRCRRPIRGRGGPPTKGRGLLPGAVFNDCLESFFWETDDVTGTIEPPKGNEMATSETTNEITVEACGSRSRWTRSASPSARRPHGRRLRFRGQDHQAAAADQRWPRTYRGRWSSLVMATCSEQRVEHRRPRSWLAGSVVARPSSCRGSRSLP